MIRLTYNFVTAIIISLLFCGVAKAEDIIIFEDNFDRADPWGGCVSDNGVWDVGTPTSGPEECYSGNSCAATILDGNYPKDTDSRLISPSIQLPEISGSEEIHLNFRHWFLYDTHGEGFIQISIHNPDTNSWSDWETLGISAAVEESPTWSRAGRELTNHSGEKIRIGFFHTSEFFHARSGWYIDDIVITGNTPVNALPSYDSSTGILHIPNVLVDGDQQYEVELEPPYNIRSINLN